MNEFLYFVSGITLYFCLDLFKTYLRKKIKNEADIEDLPIKTQIAESIRQEFKKEISTIEAQLSVLSNQKLIVDEKSVQVINQFFERCLELRDLYSRNFGDFIGKDLAEVFVDFQLQVEDKHRKLYSDYHTLLLYHNEDKELIKSAEEIVSASSAMHDTFKDHFGKIKMAFLAEAGYDQNISYEKAVENTNEVVSKYTSDQKGNLDLFNDSFTKLMKSLNKSISEFGLNGNHQNI